MRYDLLVVGGGAAGMMAAITAAEAGKKVMIIEKMNRLGKKILATGNGRCNFTNSYLDDTCYRSVNKSFPYLALEQFGWEDTVAFFERLGIASVEKEGYYYPASNQATTIADGLCYKIRSLSIPVELECKVNRIEKKKGYFSVASNKKEFQGKNVLLAAGGRAQEKLGSDGSGFLLAQKCRHTIVDPFPALTALRIEKHFLKEASGVRSRCVVTGWLNQKKAAMEHGELQITKYGVSGVLIFQLSRFLIDGIRRGKQAEITIDFLPDQKDREKFFACMREYSYYKNGQQWLEGYLPSKLAGVLLKNAGVTPEKNTQKLSKKEQESIWKQLKECRMQITGWNDFDFAQVTAGGVSVEEVSPYTMESVKIPGLYYAGEILDVDGTCGGYNLQWAWTSGYLAGRSIQ